MTGNPAEAARRQQRHLNTDSAIAVHYGASRREIELLAGEAGFTVAKAADGDGRAFVVQAAGGEVTALGTRFVVRRLDAAPSRGDRPRPGPAVPS